MAINVQGVGHVVLKVRNLERSVQFYGNVLGLKEVGRLGTTMAFFSAGDTHHDLAVLEVGAGAALPDGGAVGLYHVALKIGDDLEALRAAKAHLDAHGVEVLALREHRVSQSIYLNDPDGNGLELFVDADPALWREDPSRVATTEPLEL